MTTAIVVGGGSAGSVVARRLADAGIQVALLEAGGEDANPAIHDPARMAELWHSPDDWDYRTVPQEHAGGRRLHLPRGKVLGGSHALNAMIWVRGAAWDFDNWAALGCDGWSWRDVLPVYEQIEDVLPVVGDYPLEPVQQAIVDAYVQEGVEFNQDYNGEQQDGVSQQQVTLVDGRRVDTYMVFVKPARDAVDVVTGAHVHSVVFEDGAATGVRYRDATGRMRVRHADQVVLCGGALDSPQILQRSGIGPRAQLEALGIDLVVDAPEVGANLHDHLLSPVVFTTERRVGPPVAGVSVTQTHAFWRSQPDLPVPDTQPIHFSVPMYGEDLPPVGDDGFSLMAGIVTPRSRGRLTLTGAGLDDPVEIDLQALADDADVASLVASVQQMRRVGRRPALAAEWGATEVYPGEDVGDDELEDYVRRTAITYHHQVGTCRMGADAASVVDPRLRVRGVTGLRVVDASIMPQITTGNTNAPAVLIGEMGARFLLQDLGL